LACRGSPEIEVVRGLDGTSAPPELAHQRERPHLETLAIRARSRAGQVVGSRGKESAEVHRTEGGVAKPGVRVVCDSRFEKERRER